MAFNVKNLTKSLMSKTLPAAAGGAVSKAANRVIPASINPTMRGIVKIAAGALLPELMPKNKMVEFAALGFVGQAGGELLGALMPSLAGIGEADGYVSDSDFVTEVSGYDDDDSPINGIDGADDDYDDVIQGTDDDPIM